MIRLFGIALLLVGASASAASQSKGLYQVLAKSAEDPANRLAVCTILADDLHADGRQLAEQYRDDADPFVRSFCYMRLIKVESAEQDHWLLEALGDASSRVRAFAVLSADRVQPWSPEAWGSLWHVLQTCTSGHHLELTARVLVRRGGAETARAVFDIASNRGSGWLPYTLSALILQPQEAFREVFETAAAAEDRDTSCLGRRGLAALDPEEGAGEACRTTEEYHVLWRARSVSAQVPEVLGWDQLVVRLRQKRVIILGELHGYIPGRATQIAVLADLSHAREGKVVLVCEQGVLEYQEPVMSAARQYGIEIRMIESESLALNESPATRDEVARKALAEMVTSEPETTFVVCYGDNHRRSFHVAVTQAGVACASITFFGAEGMLASSMRATQGRIQGRCFGYADDLYFVPSGSYATLLGAPGLDVAFLPTATDGQR